MPGYEPPQNGLAFLYDSTNVKVNSHFLVYPLVCVCEKSCVLLVNIRDASQWSDLTSRTMLFSFHTISYGVD